MNDRYPSGWADTNGADLHDEARERRWAAADAAAAAAPKCGTCQFWRLYECRRHAPVMVTSIEGGNTYSRPRWPGVTDDNWCGDWVKVKVEQPEPAKKVAAGK